MTPAWLYPHAAAVERHPMRVTTVLCRPGHAETRSPLASRDRQRGICTRVAGNLALNQTQTQETNIYVSVSEICITNLNPRTMSHLPFIPAHEISGGIMAGDSEIEAARMEAT